LQSVCEAVLWKHTAEGFHGKGLERGAGVAASLALLRAWREKSCGRQAALLESVLRGGCWSPARALASGSSAGSSPLPRRHGLLTADDFHTFWSCPNLTEVEGPDAAGSQHLVAMATAGYQAFPCLWLRGLLPREFEVVESELASSLRLLFLAAASEPPPPLLMRSTRLLSLPMRLLTGSLSATLLGSFSTMLKRTASALSSHLWAFRFTTTYEPGLPRMDVAAEPLNITR